MFKSIISAPAAVGFKASSLACKGGAFGLKQTGKGLVALGNWMQEAATTLEKVSTEHAKRSSEAWLILTGQASLSDNKGQEQETVVEEEYTEEYVEEEYEEEDKDLAAEELACR